ncbi:D-amino-acid oxidase [Tolypocladium paradoxum]|uniref:D-amino-acid oxidase n=1 Tax=Tolypocladium paradoxum TaxID=94208 RepID=A0A2S4L1L1_9HYPO|nr:D-amino-acid oxidase [Tolypocladium paradoxum]
MPLRIVLLGAGVSGLTTALLLSKSESYSVTVVAKHMPGDYDIEYASPWAGANFQPMSSALNNRWERRTWPELSRLAASVPEAGIHFQKSRVYHRRKDFDAADAPFGPLFNLNPWFRDLFPDYRELAQYELPEGMHSACEYTSVCINTAVYLPWLVGQCSKQGVVLKRAVISHIEELKTMHHSQHHVDIIINASGLLACRLGGVMDCSVVPVRGQIVIVRNEAETMINTSGTDDGATEICYLMSRAVGGGTVLGGTYDKGNWDPNPDPKTAGRIMRRCLEICPDLANGQGVEGLSVVRHGVGLRPSREGGLRVEADTSAFSDGTLLIHNYGHGGWGYNGSYGCAERVVELVDSFRTGLCVSPRALSNISLWEISPE